VRLLFGNPDDNTEITRPQTRLWNNNKFARLAVFTVALTNINFSGMLPAINYLSNNRTLHDRRLKRGLKIVGNENVELGQLAQAREQDGFM
jgi:hypothetical protein